ncbi:MAG TPA: hypothetical protein VFH95_10030, partial [Candidatus Kapabacteria bacterium]|nr:hypothetical protein [Candidatus Kapabacteria bacterium]
NSSYRNSKNRHFWQIQVLENLNNWFSMSLRGGFFDRREKNLTKQSPRFDAEIASSNKSPFGRFVHLAMTDKITWSIIS